jgi:hypothetical protein
VNLFAKGGQVQVLSLLSDPLHELGLLGKEAKEKAKTRVERRAMLGVHSVGLTALFGIIFLVGFLLFS